MTATSNDAGPPSFHCDASATDTDRAGRVANRRMFEHNDMLAPRMYEVAAGVWCLVGNGLANSTFVEGPDGVIVIDTGDSIEEMQAGLAMLREHTDTPIAAVVYTHFHYVDGTEAVRRDAGRDVPVWGHAGIEGNRARMALETGPVMRRGLVHQFGLALPADGPDGLVNVGLGSAFRNPAHAPYTAGHIAATETFDTSISTTIAGLRVEMTPAPSDSDDSITIWFPDLGVCVNNLVWPALFNVFAIRGEAYRDPQVVITGIDHVRSLHADHLVGTHGPPISGAAEVERQTALFRDSIQYLWDQTIRGLNRGFTIDELRTSIRLPDCFDGNERTQQHYGLAEHHVRQIHAGTFGWFDGDESELFPVAPVDRYRRLIAGFGGIDVVRRQVDDALAADDVRWALELATWLVRSDVGPDGRADAGEPDDRARLATALRTVAQRTTAANVRNWCLTRARELDGLLDLGRFRTVAPSRSAARSNDPTAMLRSLRVLVDPDRASGRAGTIEFRFDDGSSGTLTLRNCVLSDDPTASPDATVTIDRADWAAVVSASHELADLVDAGRVSVTGDVTIAAAVLGVLDVPTLRL